MAMPLMCCGMQSGNRGSVIAAKARPPTRQSEIFFALYSGLASWHTMAYFILFNLSLYVHAWKVITRL